MNLDLFQRLESDIDSALADGEFARAESLAERYRGEANDDGAGAQSPRFRARFLSARVALDAGKLREAGAHLAALFPPTGLPSELACRLWLMSAEVLARRNRFAESRSHLGRAMLYPEALSSNATLRLREVRIALWLGDLEPGSEQVERLREELNDDPDNLALLLCEVGRAHDLVGDYASAKACWAEAGRIASGSVLADVFIQQGRLAHLEGRWQDALDCYTAAEPSAAMPQVCEARLRRSLVLLDLNQPVAARRLAEPALAKVVGEETESLAFTVKSLVGMTEADSKSATTHEADYKSAATQEARAHRAAQRGEGEQARTLYLEAMRASAGPVRQARLSLALGMLALSANDVREARRWLTQAVALARSHRLDEVLWRSLQAQGEIASTHDRDDEKARALFEEAVVVCERQVASLAVRADAAAYGLRRSDVLARLTAAAIRRDDLASVLRYQEMQRGRLLLELWRAAPNRAKLGEDGELNDLDSRLDSCTEAGERERLLLERDRLFDARLRDASKATTAVPTLSSVTELQSVLKPGMLFVSPVLSGEVLALVVVSRDRARLVRTASGSLLADVEALRVCIAGQLERYRLGLPIGVPERSEIDAHLDALGAGPLGQLLARVLDEENAARLLWVPDGSLHGLAVHALRFAGRYLIERYEVVNSFGASLFVHQSNHLANRRPWGKTIVVSESPAVLPAAQREAEGVCAAFWRTASLSGSAATLAALRPHLSTARVLHLACHAYFDPERPLSGHIGLPSAESWRAIDWLDEPLAGLPLVTLSACRSAEVGTLIGREVFGLVTGLLGAGVRAVVAGLWPIADREAGPMMWNFYRERMTNDLPTALALAQRNALGRADSSPLFWAAFALFGDPDALPAPRGPFRWFARLRQRRLIRRFFLDRSSTIGV